MSRFRAAPWLAFFAVLLFASRAAAHSVGVSRGEYAVSGADVTARLLFARLDVSSAVPSLDADGDGTLTDEEVARGRDAIDANLVREIIVRGDGAPCPGSLVSAKLTAEDGLELMARYRCAPPPSTVTIDLPVLASFAPGHRHVAHATWGAAAVDGVMIRGRAPFQITRPGASDAATEAPEPRTLGFFAFLRMGVEHILTGYDHLLFLLGLILVGGRVRSLVGVVTAFTVAHSITLGLAAFGVLAPPSRIVEPAIALSIAYVGIENFFVKNAEKRWRITFPFGLVHGFGFAAALQEIELPRAQIPVALVSFNLGVELGQLGVMAVLLPLVLWARKSEWFAKRGALAMSAFVAMAGLFWFVERVARAG